MSKLYIFQLKDQEACGIIGIREIQAYCFGRNNTGGLSGVQFQRWSWGLTNQAIQFKLELTLKE